MKDSLGADKNAFIPETREDVVRKFCRGRKRSHQFPMQKRNRPQDQPRENGKLIAWDHRQVEPVLIGFSKKLPEYMSGRDRYPEIHRLSRIETLTWCVDKSPGALVSRLLRQ